LVCCTKHKSGNPGSGGQNRLSFGVCPTSLLLLLLHVQVVQGDQLMLWKKLQSVAKTFLSKLIANVLREKKLPKNFQK
jgi:hypothetical protein